MFSSLTLSLGHLIEPSLALRLLVVGAIGIALVRFLLQMRATRRRYDGIQTLPTSWIVGELLGHMENFVKNYSMMDVTIVIGEVMLGIAKVVHEMKEGMIYFRVGPFRHIVAAMNAKTAEAILSDTKNINKAVEYDFMKEWLGNGLLTGKGPHWRLHRKLLTPTFHFSILNKFIPVMNHHLRTMQQIIDSKMDSKGVAVIEDVRPLVTNCTVDIICQTAMGVEMNAQKDWVQWNESGADARHKTREVEYADSLRSFLDNFLTRLLSPWLYPDILFRLFPTGRAFRRSIQTMHQFTNSVILKRKAKVELKFNKSLPVEESIKHISEGSRVNFLDLLLVYHLKDENDFDLVSIREEVDTFMFGGHDTTSTTLHFALMLIGTYLEKQQLIHQELEAIFEGDSDREITSEDIKQMTYLEMCIKETLRLYPPAAFFARSIDEDFKCDKYIIPAGTTVIVASYAIHHDPEVYDKPAHFIPERFSPNSSVTRNPFAFIPFSAGPRNCIGQRFAMIELKIFLATILRKYSIRSLTKQEEVFVDCAIISKSSSPIKIEFTRRDIAVN